MGVSRTKAGAVQAQRIGAKDQTLSMGHGGYCRTEHVAGARKRDQKRAGKDGETLTFPILPLAYRVVRSASWQHSEPRLALIPALEEDCIFQKFP